MNNPQTPFGYSLFCDDIRREIGNKISFLGLYLGIAVFEPEFPITVSKFCIAVNWVQHRDDEKRPVKLKVFLEAEGSEDQLVIEGDIPIGAFERVPQLGPSDEKMHAMVHIALTPLVIEGPSRLKVRAYYGEDEYKIGALRLAQANSLEAQAAGASVGGS